jgi:hypothetical protein
MTRDDIFRMAREAEMGEPRELGVNDYWAAFTSDLERFAALVAAAEREACAKLVEPSAEHRRDASWAYLGGKEGVDLLDAIAAAIRARGQE